MKHVCCYVVIANAFDLCIVLLTLAYETLVAMLVHHNTDHCTYQSLARLEQGRPGLVAPHHDSLWRTGI